MNRKRRSPLLSIGPRVRKSPYYEATLRHGAKAFTIYNHMYMPTSYTDPVTEYRSLIEDVTIWDVACQRQVEISGPDAVEFLQFLTPRDVRKCRVGTCRYLVITDRDGGIINDAVLLRLGERQFWLSPGDGDALLWIMGVAASSGLDVRIAEPDVSPLQLQGPKSPRVAHALFGDWVLELPYYHLQETTLDGIPLVVSRSGWSGELGYELYLRDSQFGDRLWERVMEVGRACRIAPIAPSTIRSIEGRLLSYRSDITQADNPYELGLGRLVDLDKPGDFIGREALERISAHRAERQLVGIEIDGAALEEPNEGFWPVLGDGNSIGHVTRCAFSPRLERNIGFANVPAGLAAIGTELLVQTSTGERQAKVCETPWIAAQTTIPRQLAD